MSAGTGEFELIRAHFSSRPGHPDILLGIGDDAAMLACATGLQVAHASWQADGGGRLPAPAALAASLVEALTARLDEAGARPRWLTLALTLEAAPAPWLAAFSAALRAVAAARGAELVGGDTTHGRPAIDLFCIGVSSHPAEPS